MRDIRILRIGHDNTVSGNFLGKRTECRLKVREVFVVVGVIPLDIRYHKNARREREKIPLVFSRLNYEKLRLAAQIIAAEIFYDAAHDCRR